MNDSAAAGITFRWRDFVNERIQPIRQQHNEQSEPGDEESDYAHTADSRINRATSDNPGRQAEPFGGGVQASATVGAGVKDAAAASSGLQLSTNSRARHPTPAHPPSESTNTRLIPLKVVFDKEAHIIDAAILRKDQF